MNLRRKWDTAVDPQFSQRVSMALYQVARSVLEAETSEFGEEAHNLRRNFASTVINTRAEELVNFSAFAMTDEVLDKTTASNASNIPDKEIIDAVAAMWNALSNVTPDMLPAGPAA